MFSNILKCPQIASNVLKCLQMYSNVAEISLSYDSCSNFKSNLKIVNSGMCKKRLVTAKLTRRKNVCHLWITHRAAGLMKFSHKLQVRALEFAYFFFDWKLFLSLVRLIKIKIKLKSARELFWLSKKRNFASLE